MGEKMQERQNLRNAPKDIAAALVPGGKEACSLTRLRGEEDSGECDAWRAETPRGIYFLKKNKGYEREIYDACFSGEAELPVPARVAADDAYSVYEFFSGDTLCRCTRSALTLALDALLLLQTRMAESGAHAGCTPEQDSARMAARAAYLPAGAIADAYSLYLEAYRRTPCVMGHGDLLPFNVLAGNGRAVLTDWEYAGVLPYPAPLARLIAHGEEKEDSLFFMRDADRAFAARYYGERLPRCFGVSAQEYVRTLGLFVFAEYCEWVYLGKRYEQTGTERYRRYRRLAERAADSICKKSVGFS